MQKVLIFLISIFFFGCGNYHYSSQPAPKPVNTTIKTLHIAHLKGVNIEPSYQIWFESALLQSLQKHSFITLSEKSGNTLNVNVIISPVVMQRYRDVDMFKTKVYVINKSVHLEAQYELFDSDGKSILQSSYAKTDISSSETSTSYADADKMKPISLIHKNLIDSMAEAIAQRVVDTTSLH